MADALGFFRNVNFLYPIMGFLKPRHARKLAQAIGLDLQEHQYVHCDTSCEVRYININALANADFVTIAPFLHPGVVAANSNNCPGNAIFNNLATGFNEPSFCQQPPNLPAPNMHSEAHPAGRPLVCTTCKTNANIDLRWMKEEIRLGVCKTCRTWALANMAVGQDNCTCAPVGSYVGGVNNNDRRDRHLCKSHAMAYWTQIRNPAQAELRTRLDFVRTRRAKKKGHGWTHKKQHGPPPVRTPVQRRAATRARQFGATQYTEPRCYCGEHIGQAGHVRVGPGGAQVETGRVRNCAGCQNFVRIY